MVFLEITLHSLKKWSLLLMYEEEAVTSSVNDGYSRSKLTVTMNKTRDITYY